MLPATVYENSVNAAKSVKLWREVVFNDNLAAGNDQFASVEKMADFVADGACNLLTYQNLKCLIADFGVFCFKGVSHQTLTYSARSHPFFWNRLSATNSTCIAQKAIRILNHS